MEAFWKSLPDALVYHVLSYVDDIDTRRAFGQVPRRLASLPHLELHHDKIHSYGDGMWLNLPVPGGDKVYQLMWTLGAFPMFFYQRTNRIHLMTNPETGIKVWRDTNVHQDMFSYGMQEEE